MALTEVNFVLQTRNGLKRLELKVFLQLPHLIFLTKDHLPILEMTIELKSIIVEKIPY